MATHGQLPGIVWPPVPTGADATALALAWQLEQSQWWPAARLAAGQRRQLAALIRHAATSTPFYRARLAGVATDHPDGVADDAWAQVPITTRDALIAAGDDLLSRAYPAAHGQAHEVTTSRTTGAPVRLRATELMAAWWRALTLRDHAWHRRDLDAHLAAIRHVADGAAPPDGLRAR